MKIRFGFVSNSSSSSFVASIDKLGKKNMNKIIKYIDSAENEDGWEYKIDEEKGLFTGYTFMDNGGLGEFLIKTGINKVIINNDN